MLLRANRAAVLAGEVNPPNCAVVSEEALLLVMADAVIVHPITRLSIRGRGRGRDSGATGAVEHIEMENIRKSET